MTVIHPTLLEQFRQITGEEWLLAAGALVGGWVLKKIAMFILKRLMKLAERTDSDFDDIIIAAVRRPIGWLCFLLGLWVALTVLPLPTEPVDIDRFFFSFMKSATVFVGFWLVVRLISGFIRSAEEKTRETNPQLAGILPLGRKTIVVTMWILAVLVALQNIGYSVASLLAGIGIGGAALAFAAKDTLANFFGSLVIFVDKPFAIGEWVKVGNIEGTVEDVSLRVTRVRTFERSLITVPNQDLTTKPIENFSRRERRRIKFTIGVTYDTSIDKIEAGIEHVRKIIAEHPGLETEEQYVYFTQFADFSLNILVQCYTLETDYRKYLEIQHALLIAIKRQFESLGIEFAFPTQSLHIESLPKGQSD
ncbi:MAG: mechanosensitive ion channel family protein [Calditrichaeota bacterium]|nr:mechanosensitive ion channel family protein [Calditrichota bacterium]MCB9367464.1 mechanosensitive ion channel family protein [Calditrichota bacterium]MCB9391389.1 mechanosensitive ion channel family protein [Calditrichota bacterium]